MRIDVLGVGFDNYTMAELVEAKHGETPQNSKIYGYSYFR